MRVSVAINLTGLVLKKELDTLIKQKFPNEIAIRGFYGEGSDNLGNIYQISNQLTLGRTEEGILDQISRFVKNLIELEKNARHNLMKNNRTLIEDKVFRAVAILSSARLIDAVECIDLISYLRLGLEYGLLKEFSLADLNYLMLLIQPGHLQKHCGKRLNNMERDTLRPELIRKKLKLKVVN